MFIILDHNSTGIKIAPKLESLSHVWCQTFDTLSMGNGSERRHWSAVMTTASGADLLMEANIRRHVWTRSPERERPRPKRHRKKVHDNPSHCHSKAFKLYTLLHFKRHRQAQNKSTDGYTLCFQISVLSVLMLIDCITEPWSPRGHHFRFVCIALRAECVFECVFPAYDGDLRGLVFEVTE